MREFSHQSQPILTRCHLLRDVGCDGYVSFKPKITTRYQQETCDVSLGLFAVLSSLVLGDAADAVLGARTSRLFFFFAAVGRVVIFFVLCLALEMQEMYMMGFQLCDTNQRGDPFLFRKCFFGVCALRC